LIWQFSSYASFVSYQVALEDLHPGNSSRTLSSYRPWKIFILYCTREREIPDVEEKGQRAAPLILQTKLFHWFWSISHSETEDQSFSMRLFLVLCSQKYPNFNLQWRQHLLTQWLTFISAELIGNLTCVTTWSYPDTSCYM
jgi:hypothetical protein